MQFIAIGLGGEIDDALGASRMIFENGGSVSKKKTEIPMWAKTGHRKPVTRREFLASGIIPFSAWLAGPSIVTFLAQAAAAAECGTAASGAARLIPFITLNLQGGAGLAANVVVKNVAGEYLSAYRILGLGLGPDKSFRIEKEFGTAEFPGTAITGVNAGTSRITGRFLEGVRKPRATQATAISAVQKTAFIWSANISGDDTGAVNKYNRLDCSGLVAKLGMSGELLPNLGVFNSVSGLRQASALIAPPAPLIVSNVGAMVNAIGYKDAIDGLSPDQKAAVARTVASLSKSQAEAMGTTPTSTAVTKLIECAGIRNQQLLANSEGTVLGPLAIT